MAATCGGLQTRTAVAGSAVAQSASFSLGCHSKDQVQHATFGVPVGHRKRGRKPLPRLPDLQQRLSGLSEQLQRLTDENVYLKNKLKILERVVPQRDESAGRLAQLLSTASAQAAAAIRANSQDDADAGSLGHSPRSPDSQDRSPSVSGDDNSACSGPGAGSAGEAQSSRAQAFTGRAATADGGGSGGRGPSFSSGFGLTAAGALSLMTGGGADAAGAAAGRGAPAGCGRTTGQAAGSKSGLGSTPAVLALCPSPDGEVPEITLAAVEELKRITPADFRVLWKHVCLQLGVLVAGADVHGPGSAPYVRLERFLERALSYMDKLTLLSPACFVHSMYTNVENGQPERPSDNFWITCARSLNLTPQQLAEVQSLGAVYEQNVVPVIQQRLQLSMMLSSQLAAASAQPSSAGDALKALSSVDELAKQLERNVLKEHQTHWDIGDFLCSSVLSPLQVAKALTVSYPYIPDGVAMLHAFKVICSADSAAAKAAAAKAAAAAAQAVGAGQPQAVAHAAQPAGQQQPFPSLAGLLAGQLPALMGLMQQAVAGGLPAGASAAAAVRPAGIGAAAVPGASVVAAAAGPSGAAQQPPADGLGGSALLGLMTALQPAQLQALMAAVPPAQLQAMLAAMPPAQLQSLLAAMQPAQLQAVLAAMPGAQLQGLMGAMQPGQLQALLASMQPAQLQVMLGALQQAASAAVRPVCQQPSPAATATARTAAGPLSVVAGAPPQAPGGATANPQLQVLAALLGACTGGASGQQAGAGGQQAPTGGQALLGCLAQMMIAAGAKR